MRSPLHLPTLLWHPLVLARSPHSEPLLVDLGSCVAFRSSWDKPFMMPHSQRGPFLVLRWSRLPDQPVSWSWKTMQLNCALLRRSCKDWRMSMNRACTTMHSSLHWCLVHCVDYRQISNSVTLNVFLDTSKIWWYTYNYFIAVNSSVEPSFLASPFGFPIGRAVRKHAIPCWQWFVRTRNRVWFRIAITRYSPILFWKHAYVAACDCYVFSV